MTRHVRSSQAKFYDTLQSEHPLRAGVGCGEMKPGTGGGASVHQRRQAVELSRPAGAGRAALLVAGGAVGVKEVRSVFHAGAWFVGGMPVQLCGEIGRVSECMQTAEVGREVFAVSVAVERSVRRHKRGLVEVARVKEVRLEPERGTPAADLREVWALTSVSDEGRMLCAELVDGL